MTRTYTLDADLIRRLVLRREREDREHERSRHGHASSRFWRGLAGVYESVAAPAGHR